MNAYKSKYSLVELIIKKQITAKHFNLFHHTAFVSSSPKKTHYNVMFKTAKMLLRSCSIKM